MVTSISESLEHGFRADSKADDKFIVSDIASEVPHCEVAPVATGKGEQAFCARDPSCRIS